MTDIVEHLRSVASVARNEVEDIDYAEHAALTEAADEIERLRAAEVKELEHDAEFERNVVTLRMEDLSAPLSDKQRVEIEAWRREQRRLVVRFRNLRRKVRGRLSDTWGVLRHGLPDRGDY